MKRAIERSTDRLIQEPLPTHPFLLPLSPHSSLPYCGIEGAGERMNNDLMIPSLFSFPPPLEKAKGRRGREEEHLLMIILPFLIPPTSGEEKRKQAMREKD